MEMRPGAPRGGEIPRHAARLTPAPAASPAIDVTAKFTTGEAGRMLYVACSLSVAGVPPPTDPELSLTAAVAPIDHDRLHRVPAEAVGAITCSARWGQQRPTLDLPVLTFNVGPGDSEGGRTLAAWDLRKLSLHVILSASTGHVLWEGDAAWDVPASAFLVALSGADIEARHRSQPSAGDFKRNKYLSELSLEETTGDGTSFAEWLSSLLHVGGSEASYSPPAQDPTPILKSGELLMYGVDTSAAVGSKKDVAVRVRRVKEAAVQSYVVQILAEDEALAAKLEQEFRDAEAHRPHARAPPTPLQERAQLNRY